MNKIKNGSTAYICKTCHQNLDSESGHIPKMPRNAAAHNRVDHGHNFLYTIREKPEFMCTYCHRWLFHKSVHVYDET